MKLKEVAKIKIGLSNRLVERKQTLNVFDLKSFKERNNSTKNISFSTEMIERYKIN